MTKFITVNDVFLAVLYYVGAENCITKDPEILHRTFYRYRNEDPLIKAKIEFMRDDKRFPWSKELDTALQTTINCGILYWLGWGTYLYVISPKISEKDSLSIFSAKEQMVLRDIAKLLQRNKKVG